MARSYKVVRNQLNILEEVHHEGIKLRRHADYPMFAVSEGGRVLGARGFWLKPGVQASGHQHLCWLDAEGAKRYIHIHRLVALCYVVNPDPETLIKVDHRDTDSTNNHYTNLRWVTARQNCQNLAKNREGTTSSRYIGVGWRKREQRWAAQIRLDGKNKGLGQFKDEADAARTYDNALLGAGLSPVNFLLVNE